MKENFLTLAHPISEPLDHNGSKFIKMQIKRIYNVQWASQNNGLKSNLEKLTYLHCLLLSTIESRSEIQKHAGPGKRKNQQAFFRL